MGQITAVKSFITLAQGTHVIILNLRLSQEVIRMTSERQFHLREKLLIPKMIARSFENASRKPDSLESKILHSKDDRKAF
jgi:hypothetical protein